MIKPVDGIKGFYRGGRPTFTDLQAAQRIGVGLGLDCVCSLEDDKDAVEIELQWCRVLKMKFFNFPLSGLWPPKRGDLWQIEEKISDLLNDGHTVFLHCLHGVDRTGIVVAKCRTTINCWAIDKAWEEFLNEGHHRAMWLLGWNKDLLLGKNYLQN